MKKILLSLTAFVWLNADKNLIEIYQNAEFLRQSFDNVKSELIIAVPDGVRVDDVDVRSTCDVTKMSLSRPLITQNAKVSELKLQISKIENEILAFNDKREFLHSIAPKVSDFEALKASGEKFYELILADKTRQGELKERLLELSTALDKQTQELRYQNLTINFACESKSVDVAFALFEPSSLKNEVRASTLTQKLEISQSISVFNPLPTPLDNLSIAIYPFSYDTRLAPDEFAPRYYGQSASNYDIQPRMAVAMSVNDSVKFEKARAKSEQLSLADTYKLDGLNIGAFEQKSFEYDRQSLDAKFSIFIDAYADANAFLMANFTPKNRLNMANTSYKVDGVSIGESLAQGFDENAQSVLYLGKNSLIKVSKKVDEKMSKSSFFGNTKTTTRSWDYEITNSSNRTWEITLAERIPLSTSNNIKISDKSNDKANIDKEGRAEYKFSLKASEKKSINFGYEVNEPK